MKKTILLAYLMILAVVSCKKNSSSPVSPSLSGTYDFISSFVDNNSSLVYTDSGHTHQSINKSAYTTINNSGTIAISDSSFNSTNVTYALKDSSHIFVYTDQQLVDSFETPINTIVPPINYLSRIRLIGLDSIYFENGFVGWAGNGIINAANTIGGRYQMTGSNLTVSLNVTKDTIIVNGGIPVQEHISSFIKTLLQKK